MSGPGVFVGVDAGDSLTLAGIWKASPDLQLEALPLSWPIRETVPVIQAFAGSGAARMRAVQSLLAGQKLDPARCILVSLRGVNPPQACETAAVLGIPDVILPARPCALTIRGLLFADLVKEYTRLVPPHAAGDLPLLREYFADMMERAAEDVQVMGLEQDDSLLDHFADMRPRGEAGVLTVALESLSDVEWLLRNFQAARTLRQGRTEPCAEVEITAVHTRCVISTPQPGWRPAEPPSLPRGEVPPGWNWHALQAGHVLCRPSFET